MDADPPTLDDIVAGLARAVRIASEQLPELVTYIGPALEMLTQIQLTIADLSSGKQRTLEQMAVWEMELATLPEPKPISDYKRDPILQLACAGDYTAERIAKLSGIATDKVLEILQGAAA